MVNHRIIGLALALLLASSLSIWPATVLAQTIDDGRKAYANGDYPKAFSIFKSLAEQGSSSAQNDLGTLYENGMGAPKDEALAAEWFRKAGEQGLAVAQFNLGVMYEIGRGIPKDEALAAEWYRKAANQGDVDAQDNLGALYSHGLGVPRDEAVAADWFLKAANQGYAQSQYNLGIMYANGEGLPQDDSKAAQWFRKAAEQGHADAENNLGVMYAGGRGVDQNFAWAVYWQAKAAQQGNRMATDNLVSNREHLRQYRFKKVGTIVRAKLSADAELLRRASSHEIAYRTDDLKNGWYEVYLQDGNSIGYVLSALLTPVAQEHESSAGSDDGWPARPAKRPGVVSCNTKCFNGDCRRTYDDGRHAHFQVPPSTDPFTGEMKFEAPGC